MISAVIIGYNEAKYIQRCLDNCAEWADEIIYFDSFSTDGSDDIARYHKSGKVRLFQCRYDNTRDQRNRALNKAKYDWRFILDVDEYLGDSLKENIRRIVFELEEKHPQVDTVIFQRHNTVDEMDMGIEATIHLVKRGVLHGGHPLHADRAVDRQPVCIYQFGPEYRVEHNKTAVQWMERARIYWYMCPYTFKGVGCPPGSEDLTPPKENWEERTYIDVMTEFMDKGLDKRLTKGYLEANGLILTSTGWGKKS